MVRLSNSLSDKEWVRRSYPASAELQSMGCQRDSMEDPTGPRRKPLRTVGPVTHVKHSSPHKDHGPRHPRAFKLNMFLSPRKCSPRIANVNSAKCPLKRLQVAVGHLLPISGQ